ncbi:hypothetical protein B0H13DRAFT_2494232 [Mycena leptocephala]|nr:hypothetical protein B0H13DRAFT_2494232 [Mycena leptocephala]
MSSLRSLILLLSLPALSSLPLVAANLHFANLDAAPPPLPALTLEPQASGFDFDLYSALSPASNTLTDLSELPGACASYVGPGKECTTNLIATNVTFEDCGDPFIVCRCADATMSMDTVLDRLGRVPIGLRRYVALLSSSMTRNPCLHTHQWGHPFIRRLRDGHDIPTVEPFIDFATATPHSSAPGWSQAITNDACAPDNYSLTNRVEDFAQMSVMKTYMLVYNGHLPPGFRADCMSHQLDYMGALPLYNASAMFGNTCQIADGLPGTRHDVPLVHPTRARLRNSVYSLCDRTLIRTNAQHHDARNAKPPCEL